MVAIKGTAPAKVNLTLHVTGQRDDGYHLLDSLVVFAGAHDVITAAPATDLQLTVTGPFSHGVPSDQSNLILKAAEALRKARGITAGATLTLEKQLPHAAGIGSGSSDAAATLKLLADLWNAPPLPATAPEVAALGADVPVCLRAPQPMRMAGIGDVLTPTPKLPNCAIVLVNPKVAVPTQSVFAGLTSKRNPAMDVLPAGLDFAGFLDWLKSQRNDLQAPAEKVAPTIVACLKKLRSVHGIAYAGMSGSGATCYGLCKNMADARHAARVIQVAEMGWWVTPADILGS